MMPDGTEHTLATAQNPCHGNWVNPEKVWWKLLSLEVLNHAELQIYVAVQEQTLFTLQNKDSMLPHWTSQTGQ
jgi:hypothetical protein